MVQKSKGIGGIKPPKFNIFYVYALIALIIIGWGAFTPSGTAEEITWEIFKTQFLDSNAVDKVDVINKEQVEVYLKPDLVDRYKKLEKYKNIPEKGPHFLFNIGSLDKFQTDMDAAQVDIPDGNKVAMMFVNRRSFWSEFLTGMLPFIIIIGIWVLIMRNMSKGNGGGGAGGVFSVGKAKAQMFDKDSTATKITFKDVAGLEGAKIEIMEIVDFLRNPKKYNDLGGKIPKGALLVGPPGTGKTLLAKAVAGEANVPFFSISGSDFVEMFVGVGASRVRDLFRQAKEKSPCIVFIDEIDAIGRARSKNGGFSSNDERENTLNQLLTEMDGFGTNAGVIILAATNRADILDKALLRAGRFDRQIHVDLPDISERKEIFAVHLKGLKLDPALDTEFLGRHTPGFSGADIANVCNEAALIAARANKKQVERQDFLDAIDRIVGGLERRSTIITAPEKRTIAFHEAGHATVSWLLQYANPLIKVTIIPRGRALGAAWYLPEERQITTKEQLLDEMASLLGGRASEDLIFNKLSTGAMNDLERVTKMAYSMIAYFGMSDKLGNVSFYDSTGQDTTFMKPYSEKTAQDIDAEVKALIDEAYQRTKGILLANKQGLVKLATMLLEREVIFSEDVEDVFGKRPFKSEGESVESKVAGAVVDIESAENIDENTSESDNKLGGNSDNNSTNSDHVAECRGADCDDFSVDKDAVGIAGGGTRSGAENVESDAEMCVGVVSENIECVSENIAGVGIGVGVENSDNMAVSGAETELGAETETDDAIYVSGAVIDADVISKIYGTDTDVVDAQNVDNKVVDVKNLDAQNVDTKNVDAKDVDTKNVDTKAVDAANKCSQGAIEFPTTNNNDDTTLQ